MIVLYYYDINDITDIMKMYIIIYYHYHYSKTIIWGSPIYGNPNIIKYIMI